jgi:integrase
MLSLEAARIKAREWLALIEQGIDPEVQAETKRAETFKAISTEYFLRKAKDHRSRAWAEAALERLVYPSLGTRPIHSINRSDIVRLLDKVEDERGPTMANHVLGIMGRVFNWHATRSDTFRSPIVRGMARASNGARSRVLTDDELRAVWRASESYAHPFGALVRFILLTASRRNEARLMTRSEITGGDWTIPAARYKTGIDHLTPLSKAALSVLPEGKGELIFTADGAAPFGNLSKHKRSLDEASGTSGWTLHDLRRTSRSLMSRAGINADHAERCLGHVVPGIRGVYDRHEWYREKQRAFEALASLIARIVEGKAEVVPIKGRSR